VEQNFTKNHRHLIQNIVNSEFIMSSKQSTYLKSSTKSKKSFINKILEKILPQTTLGELRILWFDKEGKIKQEFIQKGQQEGPHAVLHIYRMRKFISKFFSAGAVGFAESYMDGDWDTEDLTVLLKYGVMNIKSTKPLTGSSFLNFFKKQFKHWQNRNSINGSKRNISYHYDLGNEFYKLWLDKSMTYSSAIFVNGQNDLYQAQQEKYQRIQDLLGDVKATEILEIGCGWGGFAEFIAPKVNQVTGLTLSSEQMNFAESRLKPYENTEFKLQDYRLEEKKYDFIVSIEMFEAVGEKYWSNYFSCIKKCLKPGGKAALQVITIDEDYFQSYRKNPDFIQLYIFPGGMLPSVKVFEEKVNAAGLKVVSKQFFADDYANTLKHWQLLFNKNKSSLLAMGFDERFQRMWNYYLSYCQVGFLKKQINLMQVSIEHA